MTVNPSLVPVPPMGFNTWNRFHMDINERLVEDMIQVFVEDGLRDAGYEYVNIDDGWMAPERDRRGRLVPDPVRFPRGIRRLADLAHQHGLKLGLYTDCGTRTCGGLPASYGHDAVDAMTFAEYGIDYLKHDWCHVPFEDFPGVSEAEVAERLYTRMAEALLRTGHPMVLSMCNWGHGQPWEWARGIAHLWRTTPDIDDVFGASERDGVASVMEIFHRNILLGDFAGPGGFNDPDMLEVGNGGLSPAEEESHFALWCLMAAPLLLGHDLRSMDPTTRRLVTHPGLIAINQDPLGAQARLVGSRDGVHGLRKPMADGSEVWAVLNERGPQRTVPAPWVLHETVQGTVTDVLAQETVPGGQFSSAAPIRVGEHGIRVFRIQTGA